MGPLALWTQGLVRSSVVVDAGPEHLDRDINYHVLGDSCGQYFNNFMDNLQLCDYKQNYPFGGEECDQSTVSKDKIQNCSVLELELDDLSDLEPDSHHLHPNYALQQIQQLTFKDPSSLYKYPVPGKAPLMGREYITLKSWQQKRRKECTKSPVQQSHRSQRKRLLKQMIEKLDKKSRAIQDEEEIDNQIIQKIQSIVGLLGEVQKGIKTKQKYSLGMKLKMKVDPNRKYFKPKAEYEDRIPYTSQKRQQQPKDYVHEKPRQEPDGVRKFLHLKQQQKLFERPYDCCQRQYTTQNIYSASLSQRKARDLYLRSQESQRSSVEYTRLRLRREEIVEKQLRRRQRLQNRLMSKRQV